MNNNDRKKVNLRNIATIEQALKDIYEKIYALDNRVIKQNSAIMGLIQKMNVLEAIIQVQKMKLTGLGPTIKE